MAKYTVPDNNIGAYGKKLTAATVDEVEFADTLRGVEVTSTGSAEIYYTVDGTTPTVGGQNCHKLPAAFSSRVCVVPTTTPRKATIVKLISEGTPTYDVAKAALD